MKGWLDNFGKADNANESNVSLPEDFVGLAYNTKGRNYSPAWGGQFQKGGNLLMQQIQKTVEPTPTFPYLRTKDPAEFYKSWIQSPEYARRQLATGYSEKEDDLYMPSAAGSRKERLSAIESMTPITYSKSQPSEAKPGIYGSPSYVNINPLDYIDTNKETIVAHELAHIAGAEGPNKLGMTLPGGMSKKEREIFKQSMLPLKEPTLSGVQGSKEREASKRALEDWQHSQKEDEAKADLDALRFMMYDKGIYDITKGKKFTDEDFEKAKQSFGKDRVFKRLTDRVGKKNFINLMNIIAKGDEDVTPIAMNGASMPGAVGFTYARTAGAAPSEGPYAKKTLPSAQTGIMSPLLLTRKILSYFYPDEEASTVAAAPVEYKKGLTDELLKRQAYKESTFNPSAVSPAGYKGLTQIGEEVITDYSKKKGGKKLDPFNPKDAIELQKFAMDDLYNSSFINKPNQSDSVRLAKTLAAYNWGRGNLFNYLNEQKQKGVDIYGSYDWLNDLPKETSDYVNKILLQEDESFNKNYKRDSTNPKYKDITSLYDQKKFGGKITTAQNGQEMKFYQNGLDWKPKNMQEGGKIYEGQELPEFVVEGKDERIKEAMSQGINKFYGHVGELMSAPQKEMMQLITGKEQTPSQAFGFQDTGGWLDNYSSFGKNLSNFAIDAILDPVNLIGLGIADDIARTTLKGASKKLTSSADNLSKSFKSEIDWSKWNPDTPKYPELIKEYNKIEEATKRTGTWMKNPDGSPFEGTPEQFIQEQSSYFKKAYPQGYNQVYRGVSTNTSFPNFNESTDPGLRGPRGIFTANKELAGNYVFGPQGWQQEKTILTPFDPDNTPGLFELIYPKGKQITRYQNLDDWTNIDLARTPTKEDIKYSIDNIKNQLERRKKITEELASTEGMSSIADQAKMEIKSQENRIKQLQKYYDNFDKVVNDEVEFNKMKKILGEKTTTDDIARYIPKTNLRSITLQDLIDSGQGDVTIVNNRPGNYLKSKVGNVGFFDLKNPNVYKGIIPAGIATSLTFDQQKNGGKVKQFQGGGAEKISINDPRYPELYKNRQVGAYYDGAFTLPDLPEVVVEAPRSYTMKSLRDFTTAGLYGAPATALNLSLIPQAAMTEGIEMLRGKQYDFSNINPNLGYFSSNQRDLADTMGYENPEGFWQNAVNFGLSMIEPSLISSRAGILKKPLQKQLAKSLSKNFKSEINWAKWNKEIPKNKPLLQEYNAIEQQTKADGTWMKNPDGSVFDGTPEEFIQQNSSTFKKVYPYGAFTTYKGVGAQGRMDNLLDDAEFFAGDKNIADVFTSQYHTSKSPIISHNNKKFNPNANPEVHKFIIAKSPNSLRVDAKGGHWGSFEIPENSIPGLGTRTSTAELQKYVRDKGLDYITIDNLREGGGGAAKGTIHIINPRRGNMPKSAVGNSGMFDMTNPNIYKGVIPAGIATALSIDQQKNGGIIKDNQGYWNPDNWGQPVEIGSNNITMEGVYEPLLGISDTGDTKLMKPGKNYKFKGKKVTEFPVAELGINQLDAYPMKKLNQLLNFTNNPDKDNWLDKYN